MLRSLSSLSLLLLLVGLLSACGSDGGSPSMDVDDVLDTLIPDAADTTPQPDTLDTSPPDTAAEVDTTDTTDASDVPQPPTPVDTPAAIEDSPAVTSAGLVTAIAVDLDDDGYGDLAGLTAAGSLVVAPYDASGGGRPPFTFGTLTTIATNIPASTLLSGDFDGDGLEDLSVYAVATGKVAVVLNHGGALDVAFDVPLIAFDVPLIAYDAGFDVPLIATEAPWLAADLDGSGRDDFAFFAGNNGVSVAWVDLPGGPEGAALRITVDQPAGLSDFDVPLIAVPFTGQALDLDGANGMDLAVGFLVTGDPEHDGIALFNSKPGRGFDVPLIASGEPMALVGEGLTALAVADLNADGVTDLTWLGASLGGVTKFGVWSSSGFDVPLIATAPQTFSFVGTTSRLSTGRLLLDQGLGVGGAGADSLALLNALNHLIFLPADPSQNAVVVPILADGSVGIALRLLGSTGLSGFPADLNGDGFTEFVRANASGIVVAMQDAILHADYDTGTITLADGTTVAMCELAAPFCAQGARGICAYARETCDGSCDAGAAFTSAFGSDFATVFESGEELSCDGLDNDCDGVTDALGGVAIDLSSTLVGTPQRVVAAPVANYVAVLFDFGVSGPEMAVAMVDPDAPTTASAWGLFALTSSTLDFQVVVANDEIGVTADDYSGMPGMAIITEFEPYFLLAPFQGPDLSAAKLLRAFGQWSFAATISDALGTTLEVWGDDYSGIVFSTALASGEVVDLQAAWGSADATFVLGSRPAAGGGTELVARAFDVTGASGFCALDATCAGAGDPSTCRADARCWWDDTISKCQRRSCGALFSMATAPTKIVTAAGANDFCVITHEAGALRGLLTSRVAKASVLSSQPLVVDIALQGQAQVLSAGQIVADSVYATWTGTQCHVVWLEGAPASGNLTAFEALLETDGTVGRKQRLGAVAGAAGAQLFSAAHLANKTYVSAADASVPGTLTLAPLCSSCSADTVACTSHGECCSGNCNNGTCAWCLRDFDTCTSNIQCCTDYCDPSGGYCVCKPTDEPCAADTECCSGACDAAGSGLCWTGA